MVEPTGITHPLTMSSPPTGEHFEFHTSFRGPSKRFRFTWTLAPGKQGPAEHIHPAESHEFRIVSGEISIWVDDVRHDLKAGDELTIRAGQAHRFKNVGQVPVVVDAANDGATFEDFCIPLAIEGQRRGGKMTFGIVLLLIAQVAATDPNLPTKRTVRLMKVMNAIAWFVTRVLRVRPLPAVYGWEPSASLETFAAE